MKIALRADGGATIGGGHIARCLTLASALNQMGAEAGLFVNETALPLATALNRQSIAVHAIKEGPGSFALELSKQNLGLAVVDHYGWDAAEHSLLRPYIQKLAVIDDLVNRRLECDLVLDQNFGRQESDYEDIIPDHASRLIGLEYALLRPEFANARKQALSRRGQEQANRILVSLGFTDVGGITARTVEALLANGCDLQMDVIVARTAPSLQDLQTIAQESPSVSIHIEPDNLADLMVQADIAVGAVGGSAWERCCLGLPTIAVVLADNQIAAARALSEHGVLKAHTPDSDGLINLVEDVNSLCLDHAARRKMAAAAARLVDGKGAERVAKKLLSLL